jgi:hypothetical protein
MGKICDIFHSIIKDGKIYFIILAAILISISSFQSSSELFIKILTIAVPYSFAWVILAWIITDKSILRKTAPYLGIFVILLLEKIYLFASETEDYFFILVKFVVMLTVFLLLWHLAKPKDFTKTSFLKTKKMILIIICSIIMTIPHWISTTVCSCYGFLTYGLFFAIALTLFSTIITNIAEKTRYILYALIFVFTLVTSTQTYFSHEFNLDTNMFTLAFFIVNVTSYFFIFLSLLLLSKTKYLEQ